MTSAAAMIVTKTPFAVALAVASVALGSANPTAASKNITVLLAACD